MSTDSIRNRSQLLDGEIRIMRSEVQRVTHSVQTQKEKIKENTERIKVAFSHLECVNFFQFIFAGKQSAAIFGVERRRNARSRPDFRWRGAVNFFRSALKICYVHRTTVPLSTRTRVRPSVV
jgi:hypothetical protein